MTPTWASVLLQPEYGVFVYAALISAAVALAATVSLGVLAAGARLRLVEHLPGAGEMPGLIGVLYGGLFTVLIAALYVPTESRLLTARPLIVEQQAGNGYGTADLERRALVRKELAEQVELGGTTRLAATALGPFIAAAASSVLS